MARRGPFQTGPGNLRWYAYQTWRPIRFTHDDEGWLLLMQPGRKRSRWFETVLRCDDGIDPPSYRPLLSVAQSYSRAIDAALRSTGSGKP